MSLVFRCMSLHQDARICRRSRWALSGCCAMRPRIGSIWQSAPSPAASSASRWAALLSTHPARAPSDSARAFAYKNVCWLTFGPCVALPCSFQAWLWLYRASSVCSTAPTTRTFATWCAPQSTHVPWLAWVLMNQMPENGIDEVPVQRPALCPGCEGSMRCSAAQAYTNRTSPQVQVWSLVFVAIGAVSIIATIIQLVRSDA